MNNNEVVIVSDDFFTLLRDEIDILYSRTKND